MRWLIPLLLIACKSRLPSNTPSPTACIADTDCTIAMIGPDPDNPCCDFTTTAAPVSRAHLVFVDEWRKSHCKDKAKSCPPLALPGAPVLPCGNVPKCIANKCTNACP